MGAKADDRLIAHFTSESKLLEDIDLDAELIDFFNISLHETVINLFVVQTCLYGESKLESS